MFNLLLPRQADNSFQGRKLALGIFAFVLLILTAMSANSIFNGRFVAIQADGVPLDTYTPAGAQAILSCIATWGVTQLMIVLLGIITLIRYRALVPLMFSVLLLGQLLMRVTQYCLAVAKPEGVPASWFIILLLSLMALGLILSLWRAPEKPST